MSELQGDYYSIRRMQSYHVYYAELWIWILFQMWKQMGVLETSVLFLKN